MEQFQAYFVMAVGHPQIHSFIKISQTAFGGDKKSGTVHDLPYLTTAVFNQGENRKK